MARFSVSGKKRRAVFPPSSPSSSADSCGCSAEEEEERERTEAEQKSSPMEMGASETITVTIDPDALDCPICFEPLSPPVLQCCNGHVTCSACYSRMKNRCYVCPYPLGPSRCVALEKVLESIRMPCPYADNGCQESLTYAQRASHKEQCSYSPCFCPFPGCEFRGYLKQLLCHLMNNHTGLASFKYNVPFKVSLRESTSMQILLGEDDVPYLLHNSRIMSIGNSVTLTCIHPNVAKGDIMYELTVAGGESSLRLTAPVLGLKKSEGVSPSKEFLLVPRSFFDLEGRFKLEVCVRRAST